MQIYSMDSSLIEIYKIRNLESIKVWDLIVNAEAETVLVPGILISYDGNNVLNLCAKDKYFDVYARKVMEVYADEKANIREEMLVDPFGVYPSISIDERSKKILESGVLVCKSDVSKFYEGKQSYDSSMMFQIDKVRVLRPILVYHLEEFFRKTSMNVKFDGSLTGYRDNYVLNGKIDGVDKVFPFSYVEMGRDEYIFSVGGLFDYSTQVEVFMNFKADKIEVLLNVGDGQLSSSSTYKITDGVIKEVSFIDRDGITLSYVNRDLAKASTLEEVNLINLDRDVSMNWYRLPWGALYGYKSSIDEIGENERIIAIESMFLNATSDTFYRIENYSKMYRRKKRPGIIASDVELDSFSKSTFGVRMSSESHTFVVESSFAEETTDYNLARRFFCFVVKGETGLLDISRDKLLNIGKEDGFFSNGDIANRQKLLTMVKDEVK